MPEKTRVVRRPEGEPNYHIFYQLLSGADTDLRRSLGLDNLSDPNLFMTPLQRVGDWLKLYCYIMYYSSYTSFSCLNVKAQLIFIQIGKVVS